MKLLSGVIQLYRSLIFRIGGTFAYVALAFLVAWGASLIRFDLSEMIVAFLCFPLLPGAIPGGVIGALMGSGFHDGGAIIGALISTPLVNSWFCYLFLKPARPVKSAD
jgi:hypothetical protein